eukprot:CAMPEP_0184661444 /NCGR_PEP_ID=MMETSP0308-20130426/38403_1 /TAXON_ID=38269 /ORGANISM="Gloeochaete witrockiana, Strain SAG 46.84" /LENGTH=521 /DNA_ID=CAMNT_0027102755 /DNA_START=290 /DNA_END=1855 /DNA_ORIENTATION=-
MRLLLILAAACLIGGLVYVVSSPASSPYLVWMVPRASVTASTKLYRDVALSDNEIRDNEKFLYFTVCGGICNQRIAIAHGLLIAKKLKRTVLIPNTLIRLVDVNFHQFRPKSTVWNRTVSLPFDEVYDLARLVARMQSDVRIVEDPATIEHLMPIDESDVVILKPLRAWTSVQIERELSSITSRLLVMQCTDMSVYVRTMEDLQFVRRATNAIQPHRGIMREAERLVRLMQSLSPTRRFKCLHYRVEDDLPWVKRTRLHHLVSVSHTDWPSLPTAASVRPPWKVRVPAIITPILSHLVAGGLGSNSEPVFVAYSGAQDAPELKYLKAVVPNVYTRQDLWRMIAQADAEEAAKKANKNKRQRSRNAKQDVEWSKNGERLDLLALLDFEVCTRSDHLFGFVESAFSHLAHLKHSMRTRNATMFSLRSQSVAHQLDATMEAAFPVAYTSLRRPYCKQIWRCGRKPQKRHHAVTSDFVRRKVLKQMLATRVPFRIRQLMPPAPLPVKVDYTTVQTEVLAEKNTSP